MKNVKLRVPEGKNKKAHEYIVSLSPENKGVLWADTIAKAAHFYLDEMGVIGWTGEHKEEFFLSSPKREIFLPGHEPAPVKPKHKWDKEIRALLDGERVECSGNYGDAWFTLTLKDIGLFVEGNIFRIKPRTMSINGMEFPEPMLEEPEVGTEYWMVDIHNQGCNFFSWIGDDNDLKWLKRGLIQATEEGAIAQAKAMVAALGGVWE